MPAHIYKKNTRGCRKTDLIGPNMHERRRLTLRLVDQHHTAQQRGEGQREEGGVRVAVPSQELQEERQDGGEPRRRGVTFKLQEALAVRSGERARERGTFPITFSFVEERHRL